MGTARTPDQQALAAARADAEGKATLINSLISETISASAREARRSGEYVGIERQKSMVMLEASAKDLLAAEDALVRMRVDEKEASESHTKIVEDLEVSMDRTEVLWRGEENGFRAEIDHLREELSLAMSTLGDVELVADDLLRRISDVRCEDIEYGENHPRSRASVAEEFGFEHPCPYLERPRRTLVESGQIAATWCNRLGVDRIAAAAKGVGTIDLSTVVKADHGPTPMDKLAHNDLIHRIENATGDGLDRIGEELNIYRGPDRSPEYRQRLKSRAMALAIAPCNACPTPTETRAHVNLLFEIENSEPEGLDKIGEPLCVLREGNTGPEFRARLRAAASAEYAKLSTEPGDAQ